MRFSTQRLLLARVMKGFSRSVAHAIFDACSAPQPQKAALDSENVQANTPNVNSYGNHSAVTRRGSNSNSPSVALVQFGLQFEVDEVASVTHEHNSTPLGETIAALKNSPNKPGQDFLGEAKGIQ